MTEPNALVLEILRQDAQLAMSIFEQKEIASTLRPYSKLSVEFKEIDKLCQEVISILNKVNRKGAQEAGLIDNLKKTGQLLWDHLFTRQVKDKLKTAQILDLILSLDEELIHIPWELLHSGEDFLCLKFNLGRVIKTKGESIPPQYRSYTSIPKMLILANPTNDLKSAYLEGSFIKNQFDKRRKELSIDFKSTNVDTLYVKKNLRDYDIVHFAGHCEYDLNAPQSSGWVLSDRRFTSEDIYALGETLSLPTLVFSNACHSAKISADFLDRDCQAKAYSLASAFLFSGVRHYIGTIQKIEDQTSLAFAKEFYTQLISGRSVGESLRLSRKRLIKEYGITAIAWGSYLLYGNPTYILFRTKSKPSITKTQRSFSLYKKSLLKLALAISIISISIYLYKWLPTINPNTYGLFLKSRNLFLKGNNQEVIELSGRIIQKEPSFLAVYPLLADTYQRLGKSEEALKYYFDYAFYSEKREAKKDLTSAYIGIGWIYHLQGEYPKAFEFYQKAITLSEKNRDRLNEAVGLRKLAVWYIDKEDYDKALELLTKSSEINREREYAYAHRYNLACDYFDIGLVFSNKDDFVTAREFYTKSRNLLQKLRLKSELSDYYFNLGEIHLFEKQFQKALGCYLNGLKIDEAQGNKPSLASDYNMLGELYVEMGNLEEGEAFFEQAVLISRTLDARLELAAAYYNLGVLAKQRTQKNKAREYLRQAQEIYRLIDTPDYQNVKQELLELSN